MALPECWTGNDAVHHRTVGPFRITVRRQNRGFTGTSYGYRVEYLGDGRSEVLQVGISEPNQNIHYDTEQARDHVMAALRDMAQEVLSVLG